MRQGACPTTDRAPQSRCPRPRGHALPARPVSVAAWKGCKRVKPGIWRRKNAKGHWTYEIIYRDSDGRQRRQVVPGKLRDAETRLAETKAKLGKGERVAPNPRLTLALAADERIKAKAPNLTEKTLTTYRYALDSHLLPVFQATERDRRDGRGALRGPYGHR